MPSLQNKCHGEIDRDKKLLKHLKGLEKSQENDTLKDKDQKQMVFCQMTAGDSFGSRTLIPYDIFA